MKTITFVRKDCYAVLSLNRSEKGNALTQEMISFLNELFIGLRNDRDLHFLLLRAEGKNFCCGADLAMMLENGQADHEQNMLSAHQLDQMFFHMHQLPFPLVARVQGNVYGGGLGLLACSDYISATSDSRYCFSEVKLGLVPAIISPYVLQRISSASANALMLSARCFDAQEALRLGLIDSLDQAEDDLNNMMLSNKPLAMRECKKLLREQSPAIKPAQSKRNCCLISRLRAADEAKQALNKFLQNRGLS